MVQDGERADHQILQSWLPIAATRRKSRPIQPARAQLLEIASHCERMAAALRSWQGVRPPRRGPAEMARRLRTKALAATLRRHGRG
jgi:hypothetical protein